MVDQCTVQGQLTGTKALRPDPTIFGSARFAPAPASVPATPALASAASQTVCSHAEPLSSHPQSLLFHDVQAGTLRGFSNVHCLLSRASTTGESLESVRRQRRQQRRFINLGARRHGRRARCSLA